MKNPVHILNFLAHFSWKQSTLCSSHRGIFHHLSVASAKNTEKYSRAALFLRDDSDTPPRFWEFIYSFCYLFIHLYSRGPSSTEVCVVDCGPHGSCISGVCQCEEGWTGPECEQRDCHPRCIDHGVCRDGKCDCHQGWTGEHCTIGETHTLSGKEFNIPNVQSSNNLYEIELYICLLLLVFAEMMTLNSDC